MDEVIAALRRDVNAHNVMLGGDGNGNLGIAASIRTIEGDRKEVKSMLKEWESTKNQLKGVRLTLILVGVILSALGGTLGVAILEALKQIAL